jgi:SAM-dependent methyltransferase
MSTAEEINADMLSFWNGQGGRTWTQRQAHTDTTLQPVTDALLAFAGPVNGDLVLDVGCGCGAPTLDFARAVGPSGRIVAIDISAPMLAVGKARAEAAGLTNIEWQEADPSTAPLDEYDLLTSAFGTMFFGDTVGAFTNMRKFAAPGARMAIVCWRSLAENPWVEVPMSAVAPHLPPRPKAVANAPGMFAFSDPEYVTYVLTKSGWTTPRFSKLDVDLDIAAGRGLEQAVEQTTKIGAINSWLRNAPADVVAAVISSLQSALSVHADGSKVPLPAAMWLISSEAGRPS